MGDILFLAHRVPFPPDRGDKIRSFRIIEKLLDLGKVHLATFADDAADLAHAETLRPRLGSLHVEQRTVSKGAAAVKALASGRPALLPLFDSGDLRAFVARTLAERPIDAVVAFSVQMAQFVPKLPPGVRFVMDFVDVDSAKFDAYAKSSHWPMSRMMAREARRLLDFEKRIARRADASLFVSEAEAALFRERSGLEFDSIRVLENGVDCSYFDPAASFPDAGIPRQGPLIVLTGQMDYRPNIDAARAFVREAYSSIRTIEPETRFAVVGRNPAPEVEALRRYDGVIVTGAVPDIRSWLAAADVVVAPMMIARGIQNKILEAMAMARPVVCSTRAFEGIDAEPGRDLIVTRTAPEGVESILDIIASPSRSAAVGDAARRRMLERYDWKRAMEPLAALVGRRSPEIGAAA